jgi:hypothetical protein
LAVRLIHRTPFVGELAVGVHIAVAGVLVAREGGRIQSTTSYVVGVVGVTCNRVGWRQVPLLINVELAIRRPVRTVHPKGRLPRLVSIKSKAVG